MAPTSQPSFLSHLAAAHDKLSAFGFALAATLIAVIACSFCYEVIVRYFFNSPTGWTYDVGTYALCATIFLSIPELTRRGAHINVALIYEKLPPARARVLRFLTGLLAAGACFLAAWITGTETWRQIEQGVTTISTYPIPKWWISIIIPYGFTSSGIYFLRQLGSETGDTLVIGGAAP
jgi:C4-dicarboxylate transporter DctQ subunit